MNNTNKILLVGVAVLIATYLLSPNSDDTDNQTEIVDHVEVDDSKQHIAKAPIVTAKKENVAAKSSLSTNIVSTVGVGKSLSSEQLAKREKIAQTLRELANCQETKTCPVDDSDPRASSYLLGQQLKEQLNDYAKLHADNKYYDEVTAQLTQEFLDYPDGHVQEAAIDLMSAQPANENNALTLITALGDGYDAKIMNQAMGELQRYPQLSEQSQQLFMDTLKTGAFYPAQEVAKNILPFLNANNIDSYKEVLASLSPKSAKARYLNAAIIEAQLRQSGG